MSRHDVPVAAVKSTLERVGNLVLRVYSNTFEVVLEYHLKSTFNRVLLV